MRIDLTFRKVDGWIFAPMAVIFALQIFTFNLSTKYTTSGRVAVILNAYPFWAALVSGYFFKDDKRTLKKVVGSLVALVGVGTIFQESFLAHSMLFKGDVIVFISSLLLIINIIIQKKLLQKGISPIKILFYQLAISLPLYWGGAFGLEQPLAFTPTAINITSLLYQGLIVGGISFISWQYMLEVYPITQLSSYFYLVPFFSVLFGALLLHEPITWGLGIGLLLISTGIFFENK
jgi:drug/metabolite transporter (DMT)-like permease